LSRYTRIATLDLDFDVLPLLARSGDQDGNVDSVSDLDAAPAPFAPVISDNLRRGAEYYYVIPEGSAWRRMARMLRDAVGVSEGMTNAIADRRLKFFESGRALSPSYVVYEIDFDLVSPRSESLLDQINDFIDESTGLVALVEPTSRQSRYWPLIDPKYHRLMVADHDAMTRSSPRLVFD
jgi:hypothetical protein